VLEQLAKGQRYKEIAEGLHLSIDTVRTHCAQPLREVAGEFAYRCAE
jgi:DNA-binding NarL/FixJ family response regulator